MGFASNFIKKDVLFPDSHRLQSEREYHEKLESKTEVGYSDNSTFQGVGGGCIIITNVTSLFRVMMRVKGTTAITSASKF